MFINNLLNFIYPNVCGLCGKKIVENKSYACEKCSNILKYISDKGKYCLEKNKNFDIRLSIFKYDGIIREKILTFKFKNKPYLGKMFAKLMVEYLEKNNIKFDLIIPVPIHRKRYLVRGYNQSVILAKIIGKLLKIKCETNVLIKTKNSKAQSLLSLEERKRNVVNTYKIKNSFKITNKTILLVDDIYTTGSTVNECSKILKQNGAEKIIVITIAYA